MATTDPDGEEFEADSASWKKSLLHFCDTMEFQGLKIEHVATQSAPPTVEFRARMVPKG